MKHKRIYALVVIGTRPEAIKLLPVVQAMRDSHLLAPLVISTGQHSEMVARVLGLDGIVPDADLGVGRPGSALRRRDPQPRRRVRLLAVARPDPAQSARGARQPA